MASPSNNPQRPRRSVAGSSQSSSSSTDQVIGQYKRMDHIGKGSFAEVYRGIHIEKRQSVAIKSVNMSKLNKKLKDNLVSEITILRSLHHPHIVALMDCQETPSRMHIIMEFCELGDLSGFIKKRADLENHPQTQRMIEKYPNPAVGGLNEVIVRHFAKQMASALEFLRSKNYIHRDLKPQNLLLNPSSLYYSQTGSIERMPLAADANSLLPATGIESLPMLKIADFGFARVLPTTSLAETLCGSPLYMAPEILRYEKYDAKADLWSVGTVLYEMVCARPPFRANNHVELLKKIEDRKDHIRFTEGVATSRAMKNLIRALLKRKPTERMSYDAFFSDTVIRDEIPDLVEEDLPQAAEPEPIVQSKKVQKVPVEMDRRASQSPYSQSPRDKTSYGTTPPSRPSSRPTSRQHSGTPPQTVANRRLSNTPLSPIEQQPSPRDRRPALTNAATAPARPATLQDQELASAGRRRVSREEPLPPASALKEHLARERNPQRPDLAMREAAERAAQDTAIDEGFVFVEKRRVEIDALADEIAASPQTARDRLATREAAMKRRATTQGSPTSVTGATVPSRAIQIQQKQPHIHQRTGSYERKYRPSFESATSALSKAMNMVNIRGLGLSPPMMMKGVSPPQGHAGFPVYPTAQSSLLLVGDGGRIAGRDEDAAAIKKIEQLAELSHVVYGFAEVKYKQLVPVPPSDQGLGIGRTGVRRLEQEEEEDEDDELTPETVLTIAEEALVLYVKALTMLNKATDITGRAWARIRHQPSEGLRDRMENVVNWVRDRFNECCTKSEMVARKLKQAQVLLPLDHPSHPNNRSEDAGSATTIGSADNILLTTGVTAEKLMYERSLEMSRQAAVNELVGADLEGCDLNYWTARRLLEAILEDDDDSSSRRLDGEEINGLESEDRRSIQMLLENMNGRHSILKKKLAAQKAAKAQKRTSITSAAAPYPSARSSPSSHGTAR
ncbi:kinase-like protein [Byssothecium circinans]|uniref:Serine/threonine-protein kinase ATG1 n=1 Tax=Byssothecium circinans TaxID=147558 RepID=A0A6A5TER2_9PLEO|nr:kinase-like protein [Byssothecium circinans]